MKICKRCAIAKPFAEFGKCARYSDGFWLYCRECDRARAAARRIANPERAREIARKSLDKTRDERNARRRARRAADPAATKAQRKADYERYRERELTTMRKWKIENRDRMRAAQHARYWSDPDGARLRQLEYRRANPHAARAWRMGRIAAGKHATPPWANHDLIGKAYEAADLLMQVTGDWFEVDHVVPLRGAIARKQVVCGLHVEYNLQVIPRSENRAKSNVSWPDMPGI